MKLLITGAWKNAQKEISALEELGHTVYFLQNEKDPLPCSYKEVEGVVCNGLFLYHPIEEFTSLRYVQLTSVGFDRVPLNYIKERGIEIRNARGVYSIPMAEFALGGVLQLYKRSVFFYENQKKKEWAKRRDVLELFGKTVCIVGCGSVGTECAKRFRAFGCKIKGVDLFTREDDNYQIIYTLVDLDFVLSQSDVVIVTLPLTEETRRMFNAKRFKCMKEGSVLVNIARGGIVDQKALVKALDGKLMGAILDVFEMEPLDPKSELWEKENVIITPHNSFEGNGNSERLSKVIFDGLERFE